MKAPILSNTTLTVLRQCGKYLQMSRLLRPIASEVIVYMSELLDYYLYAVHAFFSTRLVSSCVVQCFLHLAAVEHAKQCTCTDRSES